MWCGAGANAPARNAPGRERRRVSACPRSISRRRGTIFVKAGEFNGRTPIVREWTTKPLKIAKASDVLICVVGATAGKISGSIDCAIGRSVAAIRPNINVLDNEYLYHFLLTQTDA